MPTTAPGDSWVSSGGSGPKEYVTSSSARFRVDISENLLPRLFPQNKSHTWCAPQRTASQAYITKALSRTRKGQRQKASRLYKDFLGKSGVAAFRHSFRQQPNKPPTCL